ncbi:DUF3825 domain-containing protein [Mucilaginibacter celer]|uniref:DUF3825 domain-containing protein n=1 Tax=Mucilaginibacter celer TaxID=2305508 RepID=A0A494VPJ9_9SPHI|nr:DUF3825 domain-containing protein [Mucilaginibacter celer]AYL96684.1 DUF3825 domain-containing protein [Mucilaginibacter celer]
MRNDKLDLPENFYEFAFMPKFQENVEQLSALAEPEDWDYHRATSDVKHPILGNYIKYAYKRLAEEKKISYSKTGSFACLNTGLVTKNQEPLYMVFEENKLTDPTMKQFWHFYKFMRRGEYELSKFPSLPEMAFYFDEPSKLVYDIRKPLVANIEHIIEDNKERFPEPYKSMNDFQLQTYINGSIQNANERVKRSYKTAVPQYYRNNIQLLIPLCLTDPKIADLALVVEDYGQMYRASTCLTLDMAINNARQIAKPDRDWLQP